MKVLGWIAGFFAMFALFIAVNMNTQDNPGDTTSHRPHTTLNMAGQ